MKIRIKKRTLSILLTALMMLPIVYAASTTIRYGFKVELAITNRNPTINVSNSSGFQVDPLAGGNVKVLISFNVTDQDGAGNINASTAVLNLTLGGSSQYYANVSATSSSDQGTCGNYSDGSTVVVINCTVVLPYFANASNLWVVNISVRDIFGGSAVNDTLRFTVNTVSGLALPYSAINFSNVNLGQQDARAYPHLLLNNTGNDDFDMINVSASALVGTTTTSESISVTSFGVNMTNSSSNLRLSFPSDGMINLRDPSTGGNATFQHGHTSAFAPNDDKGNVSVFVWVNVPSSGLSSQMYNGTWNVTVVNNP